MYHIIYKQWRFNIVEDATVIHHTCCKTEEMTIEFLNGLQSDRGRGWEYDIVKIVKGEEVNFTRVMSYKLVEETKQKFEFDDTDFKL